MPPISATITRVASAAARYRGIAASLLLLATAFATLAGLDYLARSEAAERQTAQAAAAEAEYLAHNLDPYRRWAAQLALLPAAGDPERQALRSLLENGAALVAGFRGAAVLDSAAEPLIQAGPGLPEAAVRAFAEQGLAALTQPGAAALYLLPTYQDPASGGEFAVIGQARRDADGHVAGVAVVVADAAAFGFGPALPQPALGGHIVLLPANSARPILDSTAPVPVRGYPLALRYIPDRDGVARQWRETWLRNGLIVGIAGVIVAIGVALAQRRRQRLLAAQAERRRAQDEALRRDLGELATIARRADEANRTKSRFFAQMTHELRSPLTAVLGFSEAIRSELFGPAGNPRYVQYAGLIHDAGSHLLSLIDDLLDMAKLEAGKMEIAPIRVHAAALARSVLDLFELTAKQRDVSLTATGAEDCPDLYVDLRAAKQVMINLVSNALKFTPPGGRVELLFEARPDGGVAITVADTGSGMNEAELRVAFEPFGRSPAAQREPGTGLGLPVARALVQLHGGDLTLTSEPGRGTRAIAVFPPETPAAAAGRPSSATVEPLRPAAASAKAA